jgi:uncharacterized protein DUF4157
MSRERWFLGDDRAAAFDWSGPARDLEVPAGVARALYARAVQRSLDAGRAAALYLGWLHAEVATHHRAAPCSVPGRRTRVMPGDPADRPWELALAAPGRSTRVLREARDEATPAPDDPAVATALRRLGAGAPLPEPLRDEMEVHLGVSLTGVRLHDDAPAHAAAAAVHAHAFTVGEDIYFARGALAPGSPDGRRLLAHELAHVAQALEGRVAALAGDRRVSQPSDPLEQEAVAVAARIMATPPIALAGDRRVSQPSDPLEQEAEAVAARIMATPPIASHAPAASHALASHAGAASDALAASHAPAASSGATITPPGPGRTVRAIFAPRRAAARPASGGPILRHGPDGWPDAAPVVVSPSPQAPPSPPAAPQPAMPPPVQAVNVLAPSEEYRSLGPPASAQVVIRRRWLLAQGVAATAQQITVQSHPGVVRAILRDLRDRVFPWADDTRLEEVASTGQIGLPAALGQLPDQFARPVERTAISGFGLHTGTQMVTYRRASGLDLWLDRDYLLGLHPRTVGGNSVIRDAGFMARYLQALETEVGAPMRPDWRRALPGAPFTCRGTLDQIGHIYFHTVEEHALIAAFGEPAIRAYRGRTADARDGQAVVGSPAGNVTLPAGLSADDRGLVERLLREIYGGDGAATPTRLTDADVEALRRLDADPDRAEILALMRSARGRRGTPDPDQTLADLIDTVRQQVAIHRAPTAVSLSRTARPPLVPRPVHGHLRNRSGELVPGMEGQFDFVEDDVVDRFAVPLVIIHWVAMRTHDVQLAADQRTVRHIALASPTQVATELTHYVSVDPQGLGNDRIFNFQVRQPGVYDIEAVVDHSFYFPAHFALTGGVEVLPETARHRQQQDHAFAGVTQGQPTTEPHHYDVWAYGDGERARGALAPAAIATPAGQPNVQSMDDEIHQLEVMQRQYEHSDAADARAIVEYVRTRLSHLQGARGALSATMADRTNAIVRTWGAYTSRTAGVSSGDLRVVTWLRNLDGGRLEGHLLDHTQLFEAQNYQLAQTGGDREAILEALFVALTHAYPDGTLTLRFEVPGSPGQFVQHTRVTDTIRRDVTNVVFSQPMAIAVNLTALVVGIFNPIAGLLISASYSAAQTADELQHQAAQGTLTWQHTMTSVGLLAIDLLPAVGMSNRFVQLGRVAYYALEATQLAGSMLLVAPQAAERIAQLREGRIRDLARLEDTIRTRRANNPSDAELRDLEAQAHAMRAEIQTEGQRIIGEMVAQQLIVLAAGAVVQGTARRQLSERVRGSALHEIGAITAGEQLHVPVGSSMARADGEAALQALARGDRGALSHAGVGALPETFDPRSVSWGLAELPDGDVMIVRGGPTSVDWSQLPSGVRRLSDVSGGTVRPALGDGSGADGGGQDGGGHGSGGGQDGGGHGNGGSGRRYVASDPAQLAHYRQQYPDIDASPEGTPVYRYAAATDVPDNGVSYWQTEAPHPDYIAPVVVETTMGQLRRQGEIRVDPYAPEAAGHSFVVLHNPGVTQAPGTTRRVRGREGAQGNGAAVLDGHTPSGMWRDWQGNIYDGEELFRAARTGGNDDPGTTGGNGPGPGGDGAGGAPSP